MARSRMIREIETDTRETAHYVGKRQLDPRVMAAMAAVERHEFVPDGYRERAYVNRPLPIGEGQTISQPFIVALMTDLLDPQPGDRVLEVGTGSGYQAAVLAELVKEVYSIEIVEPLARRAKARLERLGYRNVETRVGDGYAGWPEKAPFDGIMVTAACPRVPRPLVDQLAPGARLVLPLASGSFGEELTVIEKAEDGTVTSRGVLPVRFVPLTGEHGRDP
ncbi:MAG: protein-L-isoaspartate(D-aspartate) O-methyltransferase [Holophagales bacterium]|nr:protein-L-isoaspartate(D-aspartate) O-methyltransferase [Holophagales bacterium]